MTPNVKHSRRSLSPDMIAALSAVFVGVCALAVSLYQASIMRGQQKIMQAQQDAAVWPYVRIEPEYSGEGFKLNLLNSGVGPARIRAWRVVTNEVPAQSWDDLFARSLGKGFIPQGGYSLTSVRGTVLSPGDFTRALYVRASSRADSVRNVIYQSDITVCYCSVYNQCWVATLGFEEATSVIDCSVIPETERFERLDTDAS